MIHAPNGRTIRLLRHFFYTDSQPNELPNERQLDLTE